MINFAIFRDRLRHGFYEVMFDAAFFMASRLSERDKKIFAWMLKPVGERYESIGYGVGIRYARTRPTEAELMMPSAPPVVTRIDKAKLDHVRRDESLFMFCAHASEVPATCPCASDCICRSQGSCRHA